MIELLPESKGAVLGLVVSGKVDSEEENKWIGIIDNLIKEHGKISLLVLLDGKLDYEFGAAYDDLKWTFKNMKHLNKIAVVSESRILGMLVAADSPFAKLVGISEKHFETNKLQEAWDWVK